MLRDDPHQDMAAMSRARFDALGTALCVNGNRCVGIVRHGPTGSAQIDVNGAQALRRGDRIEDLSSNQVYEVKVCREHRVTNAFSYWIADAILVTTPAPQ